MHHEIQLEMCGGSYRHKRKLARYGEMLFLVHIHASYMWQNMRILNARYSELMGNTS